MKLNYVGSGKIYFNEKEYRCNLYLNEKEGGILVNIIIEKPLAGLLELPLHMGFLAGELSTGFRFSLIECHREKMENHFSEGKSVYTYYSQYLFKGVGGEGCKGLKFSKINFSVPNIMPWGEVSAYKINDKFELGDNENAKKEIYKNEQFVIEYWINNSMLPVHPSELLEESIILKQEGNIKITLKNEESIDKFVEIFNKIKRLIELSTLKKIYPSKIIGWSNNIYDMYGQEKVERAIDIISYDLNNEESQDIRKEHLERRKWINMLELLENNSFSKYFIKYELLEPVIELYIEIIHSNGISNRRIFLNIVQALETYHSRFKANNIEEFKKRIETVILKDRPNEFKEEDKAFLMANSHRFITLESRMADLLLAEFQIYFETGDIKHYDFPNVVAHTRNYYIHYDEAIKKRGRVLTESELSIYNASLLYMLEYYILTELGFYDTEKIREKLKERWGSISDMLSIIKHSNKK